MKLTKQPPDTFKTNKRHVLYIYYRDAAGVSLCLFWLLIPNVFTSLSAGLGVLKILERPYRVFTWSTKLHVTLDEISNIIYYFTLYG